MAKKKEKLPPIPRHRPGRAEKTGTGNAADPASATTPQQTGPDLSYITPDLRDRAVPIESVAFMDDNPLLHDDAEVQEAVGFLERFGFMLPLVVNTAKSPPVMVGGNKRLRAANLLGYTHVPVVRREMPDEEEKALAVVLNATQGRNWSKELLAKAIKGVGKLTLGAPMEGLMSRLAEAQKLIPKDPKPGRGQASQPTAQPSLTKCPSCGHEF